MRLLFSVSLAIALACYGLFAYVTLDRRGDEAKIESVVKDTVDALNKRDLGGTLRCLSQDYKDDEGLNRDRLSVLVAQALRSQPNFIASAELVSIDLHGGRATVTLRALVMGKLGDVIYNRKLVLDFRKEDGRHALIMPTKVWRVVSVQNLGFASQF